MTTTNSPPRFVSSNIIDIGEGETEFVYVPFREADASANVVGDLVDGEELESATVDGPATLAVSSAVVGSTDLTAFDSRLVAGRYVRFTVDEGTSPVDRTIYTVTVLAVTSEGRTIRRDVRIRWISAVN